MSMQQMSVIGNLTKDVEIKQSASGLSIGKFTTAVNRTWKNDKGEKQEEVEFINWSIFGKSAETFAQYVKKGHQVFIQGRYKQTRVEKDGETQYFHGFIVENFTFLNNKRDGEAQGESSQQYNDAQTTFTPTAKTPDIEVPNF